MEISSSIKNKIINFNIKNLIYLIIALLPLFLLMNRFPYLSIFSFLFLLVISIIFFFFQKGIITEYHYKINIFLFIICFFFLLSYFISNQPFANLFSYDFLRYDGSFFFCYLPFIIFAVPFLNYAKALKVYFWFLFVIFVIFVIFGFFEYSNNISFLTVRIDDINVGPMFVALNNSHNATGSIYAIAGIFALAFFLESGISEKIAYGGISLLCFIALVITKSRGSIVAFAVGVFFLLWINSKSILIFFRNLAILIVALIPFIFVTGTFGRIMQIFYIYDASALTRLNLWTNAIYLFKQSPIIGVGFGRYNDIAWHLEPIPLSGYQGIFSLYRIQYYAFNETNAHSSYFHFLAETGVVGLTLLILFWVLCFVIIFKAYKFTNAAFSKKIYLSVMGGIIALFVLSLTENYMSSPTVMMCISLTTSLAVGLFWEERRSKL